MCALPYSWCVFGVVQYAFAIRVYECGNAVFGMQFVRTVSSSMSLAPAIAALVGHFRWQHCILLFSQGDAFALTANIWSKALQERQTIVTPIAVSPSQLDEASFPHLVETIVRLQMRVILVLGSIATVRSVALGADAIGIVRAGWVWISDSNARRAVDGVGNAPEVLPSICSVKCMIYF